MRALFALALATTLAACAASPQVVERVRLVRPEVPAALLDCGPEPDRPALACATAEGAPAVCDLDAARYGVALREWARGCASQLRAVGDVVAR